MSDCPPPPPRGRRPGPTETRAALLAAAAAAFAQDGYAGASLRRIARDAGVDPSLVAHFFGSKAGLFGAVVEWPFTPAEAVAQALDSGPEHVGRRLAESFLVHWSDEQARSPIIAIIHAATGNPAAAAQLREFMSDGILMPLLEALGSDRCPLRAGLINAQLTGLGMSRYVLGMMPSEQVPDSELVAAIAPALQRYATGPLDG